MVIVFLGVVLYCFLLLLLSSTISDVDQLMCGSCLEPFSFLVFSAAVAVVVVVFSSGGTQLPCRCDSSEASQ